MMPTETNRDMRGRFAKREEGTLTPLPPIGRMPRTPDGLSDDAWPDIAAQSVDMPAPPVQWQTTPDRDWFSWRDWEWRDLWAVAFVGVVLAFAAHVVGWWPA